VPFEAVGVPPSVEFYKTTIPFEDAPTVALAVANVNTGTANVVLAVFSESRENHWADVVQLAAD